LQSVIKVLQGEISPIVIPVRHLRFGVTLHQTHHVLIPARIGAQVVVFVPLLSQLPIGPFENAFNTAITFSFPAPGISGVLVHNPIIVIIPFFIVLC